MLRITFKDLRLFLTDRRAVMMTFFMPIALISIFAMAFGGAKEMNSRPVTVLVTDLDKSGSSADLIKNLDTIKTLEVRNIPGDSAERLIRTGEENAVLVIHKGFHDSLEEGKSVPLEIRYDQSKTAENALFQQALTMNVIKLIGEKSAINKAISDAKKQIKDPVSQEIAIRQIRETYTRPADEKKKSPVELKMTPVIEEKQNSPGLIQAVAGTAVMMLLFGLVAIGAGMLEEKENGTLKRLLYSPINTNHILFGKMLASIVTGLLQLTVLFAYAAAVFKLDLGHNVPSLILMLVTTAFACASFGVFLAAVAKSRQQVQMLSTLTVLSMSAIGGSMVPSFLMPAFMQKLSVVSVNYWSIQGFYDIYWRDLAFTDPAFLLRPAMLVVIGCVMMTLALIFFRRNVLRIS